MLVDRTRWRLDIGYDGTNFAGWAAQTGQRTVQGELELWITRLLRLDEPVRLVCAGRTDAGVHARGQVAHGDLDPSVITDGGTELARRLGRVLADDLVVRHIAPAPVGFDARYSAIWRRYVYRIGDASTPPDPLLRNQVTALRAEVDLDAFNAAAAGLLGLRDFGAFCRRRPGATTIRTLLELHAERVRLRAAGRGDRVHRARGRLLSFHGARPGRRVAGGRDGTSRSRLAGLGHHGGGARARRCR